MSSLKRFQSEPAGVYKPFAGSVAPAGYLLANGDAVSRTTYARLFAVIGTAFGVGDGVATFNIPDMRGRLPLGADNMGGVAANRVTAPHGATLGASGGEEKHTPTGGESAYHTHSVYGNRPSFGGESIQKFYILEPATNGLSANKATSGSGSGAAFNVLQPSQTTSYIIKY